MRKKKEGSIGTGCCLWVWVPGPGLLNKTLSPTHSPHSFLASSPASPQPPASLPTASPNCVLLHCPPFSLLLLISHVVLELPLHNSTFTIILPRQLMGAPPAVPRPVEPMACPSVVQPALPGGCSLLSWGQGFSPVQEDLKHIIYSPLAVSSLMTAVICVHTHRHLTA